MASYNTLKSNIAAYVKQNGVGAITGNGLQGILNQMVNSLGNKYQFVGVAQPNDNPGTPDYNVAYLAGTPGYYPHFGNKAVAVNQICVLKYDGSWTKEVLVELRPPQMTPYDSYSEIPESDWSGDTLTLDIVSLTREITHIDVPASAVNPEIVIDTTDISNVDDCEFVLRIFNSSSEDCLGPEVIPGAGATYIPSDKWGLYQFAVISHSLYLISYNVI